MSDGGRSLDASAAPRIARAVKVWFVVVATLGVLFIRRRDAFLNPQFWAEDFFFLLDAEKMGLSAFVMPRGGYLHLLPRTIAWLATNFDPALQPSLCLLFSLVVTLGIVFLCLSPRHALPGKLWLAAAVLIVPHSGEVFMTATNLQWIVALGLVLTVVTRDPARPRDWVIDVAVLVFAGLSGPFVIFALPLFGFRAWRQKSRASLVLLAIVVICAIIQGWFVTQAPPDREFVGEFSLFNLLAGGSHRIAANLFVGIYAGSMGQLATLLIGAATAGFVAAAVTLAPRHRTELLALLAFVVLLLAATTLRKRFDLWTFSSMESGDRYFFVAKVILLWVLGVVVWTHGIAWFKYAAVMLLLASVLLNAPRFTFFAYHDFRWYAKCHDIRRGELVLLEINPGWKFRYRRGSMESYGPLP